MVKISLLDRVRRKLTYPYLRLSILERPSLLPEEIWAEYYADEGFDKNLIVELLHEISRELVVPVGKIRPIDSLYSDLCCQGGITPRLDRLSETWLQRVGGASQHRSMETIETVDDYVRSSTLS